MTLVQSGKSSISPFADDTILLCSSKNPTDFQ